MGNNSFITDLYTIIERFVSHAVCNCLFSLPHKHKTNRNLKKQTFLSYLIYDQKN